MISRSKRTSVAALAPLALIAGLIASTLAFAASPAQTARDAQRVLTTEIEDLARPIGGMVGVAAWRLDGGGARVVVNGRERFPMASTFKIAVAGAVFAAIDAGRMRLDQSVAIDPALHVPSEVIADRFIHPGVSLSVHNLLELMLTESDNTATDVLMALVGGAPVVTAWVERQRVDGQRIDRDTAGILRDFLGLGAGPFETVFNAAMKADPQLQERSTRPNAAFDA
ncbi:MAG: serine hydrolase, partial [Steroidobacteraceae bacterium]